MPSPSGPSDGSPLVVREVLGTAVEALGGQERPGQIEMAEAVGAAFADHRHLVVQAGTGTGKSLAYLVPALLHDERVVVATATLALQHQLVERDLPRLVEAVGATYPSIDTSYAVLKGRSNYACLHRIREGVPDDQGALIELPTGSMATKVLELRAWAEEEATAQGSGERDHAPRHTDREWRQVSVSHRDCLGASRCPFGEECFVERARETAHRSHLIITNHSLLAIDAIEGVPMIPDYDVVVVDEAHEVVSRVTQAATDEMFAAEVDRAARRSRRWVADADRDSSAADDLADAGDALAAAIGDCSPGRFDVVPEQLADALALVRDAARACLSAYPKEGDAGPGAGGSDADAGRTQARGSVQDVFVTAERMAAGSESDVLWLTEGTDRLPPRLCVAPLEVWGPMREKLLSEKTVVLTSATLMLGGDFNALATSVGLKPTERVDAGVAVVSTGSTGGGGSTGGSGSTGGGGSTGGSGSTGGGGSSTGGRVAGVASTASTSVGGGGAALPWVGLDVGSPFDYARQGVLYIARHLPPPGRDGLGPAQLDEIVSLVDAADGRTLGLFSSRRAAETAAEAVRERLPHLTTLAQGDAQLPELARQFVSDPFTSLFGTLSLWQGLDVPGETCQLVIIDRIPFPRPDDPLMSARQRAADREGRNGFMQVAATHAALLLAQGTGRLIRTTADRGVVAVLDPRLATARYGSFLRASLPPMWPTYDGDLVRSALARLAAADSGAAAGE
ncbi:ATP-dependent DNA helicase [Nocardioides cynanchi]|uniref:ATP-dependent DNA helicase n=1 Tax=Nocardioides cynanchi TaxID=2558918 RepID=UPI001244107C|nr:ATP-dependent DNA helicase [Nocardioides cynanchi]